LRKKIKIGEREFLTKKEALIHYKTILNSYDFGQSINESDLKVVLDLLETHPRKEEKKGVGIKEIRVTKLKYKTKAFELVRLDGSTEYFSYTKRINAPRTNTARFGEACRKAIQEDMRNVKQTYFDMHSKKGKVKCQETKELLSWEQLNVDHRQPNTFSVILDRFIELNKINVEKVEFIEIDGEGNELADLELKQKFIEYHREKANLRIVNKENNLGRSYQARIGRQKKDLTIDKKPTR
jgi:hypothetical protein